MLNARESFADKTNFTAEFVRFSEFNGRSSFIVKPPEFVVNDFEFVERNEDGSLREEKSVGDNQARVDDFDFLHAPKIIDEK